MNKVYEEYKSGRMTSGEIKKLCIEKMDKFMADFNKKVDDAKKNISKLHFIKFN